jgi:hypothetical protein
MLPLTTLPSGSVVNIAPGSGCAEAAGALKLSMPAMNASPMAATNRR